MLNSSPDPSFFHPAGARLTVIFLGGKEKPVFLSAARMRSLLSRTVASGSPTMENCGSPPPISTSTSIKWASKPSNPALKTFASTAASGE